MVRTTDISIAATLPAEILSKVFYHCISSSDSPSVPPSSPSTGAPTPIGELTPFNTIILPLTLSSICHAWRHVALTTHALWSRLFLSITPNNSYGLSALTHTWLSRSGRHPLDIYLIWEAPPYEESHPVLELVRSCADRWRSIFLFMPFEAYKSLRAVQGHLPMLEELSLGTVDDGSFVAESCKRAPHDSHAMFSDAPSLRSVECVHLDPHTFDLPWHQLTHLPNLSLGVSDSLSVFRRAGLLNNVSFLYCDENESDQEDDDEGYGSNKSGSSPPSTPTHLVQHDNLRDLSISVPGWSDDVDTRPFFTTLSAPGLESLRISNVHHGRALDSAISSFLLRVEALQSLYLRQNALSESELIGLVKVLPALKQLRIIPLLPDHPLSSAFLDALTWKELEATPKTRVLPQLEELEVTVSLTPPSSAAPTEDDNHSRSATATALVRMVESRTFLPFRGSSVPPTSFDEGIDADAVIDDPRLAKVTIHTTAIIPEVKGEEEATSAPAVNTPIPLFEEDDERSEALLGRLEELIEGGMVISIVAS